MQPPEEASWDPMHTSGPHANHWTTTNIGEAVPGVLTPLATTHWVEHANHAAADAMYFLGVLSRAERHREYPPAEQVVRLFYGRTALRLEYMTIVGDRMPGVTGEEVLKSLLNEALDTIEYHPTRRRYPAIAAKAGYRYAVSHRHVRAVAGQTDQWWRRHVERVPHMGEAALIAAVDSGFRQYQHAIRVHMTALFGSLQPTYDALDRLLAQAGVGDISVLSGTGGAEMAVVTDLWRASRGEIGIDDVVRNHGFHGPSEGEVSSSVWRDDDTPLRTMVEHYSLVPDDQSPMALEAAKAARLAPMTAEVLDALPAHRRPGAKSILALARHRVPDRGRGKRAYLQAVDVTRMAARRLGELWAERGVLTEPGDVFFLTEHDIARPLPHDVKQLVAQRRDRWQTYKNLELAQIYWRGCPQVRPLPERDESTRLAPGTVLTGTAASGGVAEGPVRVVVDPTFEDVEPGEILVSTTTDPSWCTIMFVSAALVVDLGGALSHAAVVAREIGIPCVVNTSDGTRRLRTGDYVRVDGNAGTVTVLATVAG